MSHKPLFSKSVRCQGKSLYDFTQMHLSQLQRRQAKKVQRVIEAAIDNDTDAEVKEPQKTQHTFVGWNPISAGLLPHGCGDKFPAFLTWRGAVDLDVIDLMQPLFDKGLRPEALSDVLLEMHSETCTRHHVNHKRKSELQNGVDMSAKEANDMHSTFSDSKKYDDLVPTGGHLSHVFKLCGEHIKRHLSKEVKKRGAETSHWDASCEEPRHLCQCHGKALFKGLIAATDENGEIRIQFHAVTDGHDQMRGAITSFLKTTTEHGQKMPMFLFADNPSGDRDFFWQPCLL